MARPSAPRSMTKRDAQVCSGPTRSAPCALRFGASVGRSETWPRGHIGGLSHGVNLWGYNTGFTMWGNVGSLWDNLVGSLCVVGQLLCVGHMGSLSEGHYCGVKIGKSPCGVIL